ncbi:hypothetical protein SAMD00019534_014430 [Acytostelium subglobosum LB1]|uniref:hypothetical protein n=1 Tax=Acytostelium subglobosum LB1 TaxID=1410327 RepID=UPI000644F6CB|nr:hypothetical protein SAMD00019534_014430 [Acytostelium subglobosum LB1]GAM18268.1 hypothetical protein SAMD00019534_014430 [Acytostelium subglobosum LB1]|eukprot:XP_012758864.1 hypothetical protein SAMD00019534_014430 [Acytostelium subglobosum LB1]
MSTAMILPKYIQSRIVECTFKSANNPDDQTWTHSKRLALVCWAFHSFVKSLNNDVSDLALLAHARKSADQQRYSIISGRIKSLSFDYSCSSGWRAKSESPSTKESLHQLLSTLTTVAGSLEEIHQLKKHFGVGKTVTSITSERSTRITWRGHGVASIGTEHFPALQSLTFLPPKNEDLDQLALYQQVMSSQFSTITSLQLRFIPPTAVGAFDTLHQLVNLKKLRIERWCDCFSPILSYLGRPSTQLRSLFIEFFSEDDDEPSVSPAALSLLEFLFTNKSCTVTKLGEIDPCTLLALRRPLKSLRLRDTLPSCKQQQPQLTTRLTSFQDNLMILKGNVECVSIQVYGGYISRAILDMLSLQSVPIKRLTLWLLWEDKLSDYHFDEFLQAMKQSYIKYFVFQAWPLADDSQIPALARVINSHHSILNKTMFPLY